MLTDLLNNQRLDGMHFADVIKLMGVPELILTNVQTHDIKEGLDLHYSLERYDGDDDRQRLVVTVDDTLVVREVLRTQY